jgi:HAD superfamily hydrolase (TIGR01509 family)
VTTAPERRFRAVAFDFDGLLFNTEELYEEVGRSLLDRRRRTFCAELRGAMMGKPNRVALQIMIDWHQLDDTVDRLLTETDELFAPLLTTRLAPMPGAASLLDRLEADGIPKCIVTSGRREFVRNILDRFGWTARFSFLVTPEDVVRGKPHPDPYLEASARFRLPPPAVLALEDSRHGTQAALAAGNGVVVVPGTGQVAAPPEGVLLIADSLDDPRLLRLLGPA